MPFTATADNRFPTSIHVLVSAILKLARRTRIPRNRKAYRGLGRMRLGGEWFRPDARGARSGVELGFMSTTLSRRAPAHAPPARGSSCAGGPAQTPFKFISDVGAPCSRALMQGAARDRWAMDGRCRHVALEYSGVKRGEVGTVFEFDVGAVDCGARLDPLSQYPGAASGGRLGVAGRG
jgi:hypothetical protein